MFFCPPSMVLYPFWSWCSLPQLNAIDCMQSKALQHQRLETWHFQATIGFTANWDSVFWTCAFPLFVFVLQRQPSPFPSHSPKEDLSWSTETANDDFNFLLVIVCLQPQKLNSEEWTEPSDQCMSHELFMISLIFSQNAWKSFLASSSIISRRTTMMNTRLRVIGAPCWSLVFKLWDVSLQMPKVWHHMTWIVHDQLCWNRDTDPGSAMPLRTLFHRFCGQERLHRQSTMSSAKNWTVSHRVNPRNSGRRFFMNSNTVSITRTKPKTFSRKAVWDGSISNYINTRLQPWYPNLEK